MNYNNAAFEAAAGTADQLLASTLPEVCFSGRSNVGKSSLINRLLGRKSIARVSTKPGKTVTVNFFRLGGLRLADLPGYGYAKVAAAEKLRWAELMEQYFSSGRRIAMVFQLIDLRHAPSAEDREMLDFLQRTGYPFTVVLTKSDKLNKTEYTARLRDIKEELDLPAHIPLIPLSAQSGEGVEALRNILEQIEVQDDQ